MTIDELVGENVQRARVALGLSAHELARRVTGIGLALAESSLVRLEAGEDRIGVDELVGLGLALGMPPALLLAPLNLGSLLWVDAEGRAMPSWAEFHDQARSFSAPKGHSDLDGWKPALETASMPMGIPVPPPPPSPPPPPEPYDEPPAWLGSPPAHDEQEPRPTPLLNTLAVGAAAAQADPRDREDDPLPPPVDPAPRQKGSVVPHEAEMTPEHRDWALEALQSLQQTSRDT